MTTPHLIEQTAKRWKLVQLVGVLVACVGASLLWAWPWPARCAMLFVIATYITGRMLAWWNHG